MSTRSTTTPTAGPSNADALLQTARAAGIIDPKELSNFMGQMQIESQGFTRMQEGLNYSAERLLQVFPGRNGLKTLEDAQAVVNGGQEKIAEAMYGGKWGEGNLGNKPGSADGFGFRGRGFVHLTGRDNYAHYGKALGLDLVNNPELAAEPKNAAAIAVQYWKERVVARCHETDVNGATNDITGNRLGHHESFSRRQAAATEWNGKLGAITDKHHPGHALYVQSLQKLEQYNIEHGIQIDAQHTRNAAAALAVEAHRCGFKRIDHVEPNANGERLIVAQGTPGGAHSKMIDVPAQQAMNTPLAQSSQAYNEKPQAQQQEPHQTAQTKAAPSMTR